MKKLPLLALLIIGCLPISAQDTTRKGFVSGHIGVSLPAGAFNSKDYNYAESGYATTGLVLDLKFGYRLLPKFGLTATFRSQVNAFFSQPYAQGLAYDLQTKNNWGTTKVIVDAGFYNLAGVMGGIFWSVPLKNKMKFEPRFLFGVSVATLPEMTTEAYSNNNLMVTYYRQQVSSTAPSSILGCGFIYDVNRTIRLFADIDYYSAYPVWTDVREIAVVKSSKTADVAYFNYYQKFRTLNLSAGLGVKF